MQVNFHEPFEGQLYKMVKHTQIIRRQKPTNVCLTILWDWRLKGSFC